MTMSSFNSLSLDPPVVTFHVATPSRTLDAVQECRRFNVHILAGDVAGAKVADWFTRGNLKGVWEREGLEGVGVRIEGDGDNEAIGSGEVEPPILRGNGVLYVLRCKLLDEAYDGVVMVRDHAIVLGEVVDILEGSAKAHSDERFGLVYADRRYRQLGNSLVKIPADGDAKKTD
jgi:flavin reductase (DIM6/NTAB) family NADH-FMN oxidoreductase RutF